jgi:hypothetical protein
MYTSPETSTFQLLQKVRNGDMFVGELNKAELDRYEVLLFMASELLVLKGLAEHLPDKSIEQELGRISSILIERAREVGSLTLEWFIA